jgi:glyoxylase-like metal-dependent hydrolase (beta-lactamase superfamily II)
VTTPMPPDSERAALAWQRPAGLHAFRGLMAVCHLLVEDDRAWLIDTGMIGETLLLRRLLRRLGLGPRSIQGILLTHGHLDHAGNLARIRDWTGAPIYAHPLEQRHIDGTYPYTGLTRWCGRLERLGRAAFRYRPARIDRPLADGDLLPFWGGLQVMHLPGHTVGHCAFYSSRHDLLFAGDLFASYFFRPHLPPAILNSQPERIPDSLRRVQRLAPRWIVPCHYDVLDGALHRRRFDRLAERVLGSRAEPEGDVR